MATQNYMQQSCNVGIHRSLAVKNREHLTCLLRILERLPIISAVRSEEPETLVRQLQTIHKNHQEIARLASQLLSPTTEGQNHEHKGN